MATLENAAKAFYVDLGDAAGGPSVPVTVRDMVELFGGGAAGKSALARELATERGIKYESARRNIERYTTERGTERRTPKRLAGDLGKIAGREAGRQASQRILDKARREGVSVRFSGDVRISKDERPRSFTVRLTDEELAGFVAEAQGHHWRAAADELNYAVLDAWDEGRGGIVGYGGVITDVDELTPEYGGGE